jgi:hypothetical protein
MPLEELIDFYTTLTPESLPRLAELYAANARFKDPFNDVEGVAAIEAVFRHMFAQVEAPSFTVLARFPAGKAAMLLWNFDFRLRGLPRSIHGATHLRFDGDGRVAEHRDYWDSGEELYVKLPVAGGLFRLLRRLFSAPPPRKIGIRVE